MLRLQKPISYVITSGKTSAATTPVTKDFQKILQLIEAAVVAKIDLIQIREKALTTRVLLELAAHAAEITGASATKLLINDRADVAASAGANGVHLTRASMSASVVRQAFGKDFLIGVSTHSLEEASAAEAANADFAVFGPVFETPRKTQYGSPLGLEQLKQVCSKLQPFPILAIGGVTESNFADCLRAGAVGAAAIRMFEDPQRLRDVVQKIHSI